MMDLMEDICDSPSGCIGLVTLFTLVIILLFMVSWWIDWDCFVGSGLAGATIDLILLVLVVYSLFKIRMLEKRND